MYLADRTDQCTVLAVSPLALLRMFLMYKQLVIRVICQCVTTFDKHVRAHLAISIVFFPNASIVRV